MNRDTDKDTQVKMMTSRREESNVIGATIVLLMVVAWGMVAVVEMVRRYYNEDQEEVPHLAKVLILSPEKKHDNTKSHQAGSNDSGPTLP